MNGPAQAGLFMVMPINLKSICHLKFKEMDLFLFLKTALFLALGTFLRLAAPFLAETAVFAFPYSHMHTSVLFL
jgi:hypothetical protein